MKTVKKLLAIALIASGIGLGSSCKKILVDADGVHPIKQTGSADVYIRDAAGSKFDEVNLDITGIEVYVENETPGWHAVKTQAGVYNLMTLQTSKLIAGSALPVGRVSFLKIHTGLKNSVKLRGESFNLRIDADRGMNVVIPSGYTISRHMLTTVKLDFNSAKSITLDASESVAPGYVMHPNISVIGLDDPTPVGNDESTK
jgi:hypothetical protein